MDNPVYGAQVTSGACVPVIVTYYIALVCINCDLLIPLNVGVNSVENPVQSGEVYRTVANELYADTSAPANYDYSKCGPADSPDYKNYTYVQTNQPDEDGASPYEIPNTLVTSK